MDGEYICQSLQSKTAGINPMLTVIIDYIRTKDQLNLIIERELSTKRSKSAFAGDMVGKMYFGMFRENDSKMLFVIVEANKPYVEEGLNQCSMGPRRIFDCNGIISVKSRSWMT